MDLSQTTSDETFPIDFRRIWAAMGDRLPRWSVQRRSAILFERTIGPEDALAMVENALPQGTSFRPVRREEFPACAKLAVLQVQEIERRYEHGDVCYALFLHDRLVNLNWLHFGSCYVRGMNLRLDLEPTDGYLYGIGTDPACRGQGFYKATQQELVRHLAAQGTRRLLQLVMDWNAIPIASLPRLGYRPTRHIRSIQIARFLRWTTVRENHSPTAEHQFRWKTPRGVFSI